MNIVQILFSLIMVGIAASLVFSHVELDKAREELRAAREAILRIELKAYTNADKIARLESELKRLNELHQPQLDARNQAERESEDLIDRHIKYTRRFLSRGNWQKPWVWMWRSY